MCRDVPQAVLPRLSRPCFLPDRRRRNPHRRRRRPAARHRWLPRLRRELGLPIQHVLLTHLHADFIAGHLELRDRLGATIYLGARASAEYASRRCTRATRFSSARSACRRLKRRATRPTPSRCSSSSATTRSPTPCSPATRCSSAMSGRPDLRAARGLTADQLGSLLYDSLPEAAAAARRDARLSRARRRLAVRQGHRQGDGFDHRRTAQLQLRAAADDHARSSSRSSPPTSRTRPPTSPTTPRSTRRSGRRSTRRSRANCSRSRSTGCSSCKARRAVAGRARRDRLRRRALARQPEHRARRAYATWAGRCSTRAADRAGRRPRPRKRSGAAPRPHRLRQRRRLSRTRHARARARPALAAWTERLSPALAEELSGGPPLAVDVRTPLESDEGRFDGAMNIPLSRLAETAWTRCRPSGRSSSLLGRLPLLGRREPACAGRASRASPSSSAVSPRGSPRSCRRPPRFGPDAA